MLQHSDTNLGGKMTNEESVKAPQIELFDEDEKIMMWECPITGEVPADWTCPFSVIGGKV